MARGSKTSKSVKVNFKDVIGRRPVALLFATPALCQSRTCGPVTDLTLQVKSQYGKRMTFIHEEIYVKKDEVMMYVSEHQQVLVGKLTQMAASQAPLQLLQGVAKLDEEFEVGVLD